MSNNAKLPVEPGASQLELLAHLRQLFESPAFKGSRRSQQFLQHIVEQTLAGQPEQLKERSLGVALFGRDPAYDTGEDAVVRVTASDVRKRLQHFYAANDTAVRIELLAGSYTPEFRHVTVRGQSAPEADAVPATIPAAAVAGKWRRAGLPALLIGMAAVSGTWLWSRGDSSLTVTPRHVLPWSVLFQEGSQLQVVLADPDVSAIQELTGTQISLPDYANRNYTANAKGLGSEMQRAIRLLRGVNVAAVDVGIALSVSRLAGAGASRMKIHPARSLQLSAFRTDDDFILLGSSRSNPWGALFEDQLDFDFIRDAELNREVVRNKRVQGGELARYVPTAGGWDTGDAYAIIALVRNPNQAGKVLLVAGTNAEGTEAAGQFVTNTAELARTLRTHGIDPGGAACHFEILLRVRTMAGSPSTLDVVACHRLPAA